MDFSKVPIGFGMVLAVNEPAMNTDSKMTEAQKQAGALYECAPACLFSHSFS